MRIILMPAIFLLLVIISAAIFIGGGYLISLVIPLTLFQSSIISIGSTFVLGFVIILFIVVMLIDEYRVWRYGDEEDDYDDEEDEEDVEEDADDITKRKIINIKTEKTGRNEPCPCGSGKKYKFCCGK